MSGRRAASPLIALTLAAALSCAFAACKDDGSDAPATASPMVVGTQPVMPTPGERAQALCASAATAPAAVVQSPEAQELSGLAASQSHPDTMWTHNDSGDSARVLAITTSGEPLGVYDIAGAAAIDWEAMAVGPGETDGTTDLYLGDIGDNAAARSEITVYRVAEPSLDAGSNGGATSQARPVVLHYPDGAHDAEALLVDPRSGDAVIVTKDIIGGRAGVYVAPASMLAAGGGTMEKAGEIARDTLTPRRPLPDGASPLARGLGYAVTDGSVSTDGALVALRTYATVWIFARDDGESIAQALAGTPCEGPSAAEAQGEAIAFAAGSDGYFTTSEGEMPPLHRFASE